MLWFCFSLMIVLGLWLACCGFTCIAVNDTFASDTLADYTTSGTWSHSGSAVHTSSAAAQAIHDTALSTGKGTTTINVTADIGGLTIEVIGSYVDDNNCLIGRYTTSGTSATFELFQVVGGAETQLGATYNAAISPSTNVTLAVCWNGVRAGFQVNGTYRAYDDYTGTGTQGGFTAAASGGTVDVLDFKLEHNFLVDGTCAKCNPCQTACQEPTVVFQMQMDVDGLANNVNCSVCAGYNALYICDLVGEVSGRCRYLTDITLGSYCNDGLNDISQAVVEFNPPNGCGADAVLVGGWLQTTATLTGFVANRLVSGETAPYDCDEIYTADEFCGLICDNSAASVTFGPN